MNRLNLKLSDHISDVESDVQITFSEHNKIKLPEIKIKPKQNAKEPLTPLPQVKTGMPQNTMLNSRTANAKKQAHGTYLPKQKFM